MKKNPDLWNERTPTMLKLMLQLLCFCSNDRVWVTFGVEMTSDQIICVETNAKKMIYLKKIRRFMTPCMQCYAIHSDWRFWSEESNNRSADLLAMGGYKLQVQSFVVFLSPLHLLILNQLKADARGFTYLKSLKTDVLFCLMNLFFLFLKKILKKKIYTLIKWFHSSSKIWSKNSH